MRNSTLIKTGAIGAVVAAICCATPLLAILLGTVGLAAWVAKADYVLIPVLLLCIALGAIGTLSAAFAAGIMTTYVVVIGTGTAAQAAHDH